MTLSYTFFTILTPASRLGLFQEGDMANESKSGNKRTTIGLKESTKIKLDKNRAPGQCYDGFINQLVDLWEKDTPVKQK